MTDATRLLITPRQKVENELALYLDSPFVSAEYNILEWWRNEQMKFPTLAKLARSICGTSVPSERIFSKASYINDHLHSKLDPKNVDKLVFISKNMLH